MSAHETTSVALVKFTNLAMSSFTNRRHILKMYTTGINAGQSLNDVTVQVLGMTNASTTWDQTSASWNGLSSNVTGLRALLPLESGLAITEIDSGNGAQGNFINWNSTGNISIAGHITVTATTTDAWKMIDITEYVESVLALGGDTLTLLFYRPFRHPAYETGVLPNGK
jgi:hypothetical protein